MFGILPFKQREIFLLAIIWTHLIFYGCTIPGTEIPEVRFDFIIQIDKLVHATFFFVFFLLWSCTRAYTRLFGLLLILVSLLYGLFIEYFQFHFVDGRGFEIADMLADTLGAVIGFFTHSLLRPFYYSKD